MRDPFTKPFCRPEDLGLAIPDSDHAVSVCLPRWRDVIGYEEGDPDVIETFECGYPRFVLHPFVAELFLAAQKEFAKKDEVAIVFPSLAAAWRCADYVKRRRETSCRLESYGWGDLTVLLLDESAYDIAWKCWQHGGEIVSSRLAESALTDGPLEDEVVEAGGKALQILKERLAGFHEDVSEGDVFLFSSGMAAIFAVHRLLLARKPAAPTIQIEFPYLDSFKMQEEFGDGGVIDFSMTTSGGLDEVSQWFEEGGEAAGVYTELPSNPLLKTADLKGILAILRAKEIPLIVDDTVATSVNVNGFLYADVLTTSLTKLFSGAGDVAAGAVILNPASPFYAVLKEDLALEESASPLFARDAITLEINSRHFEERVRATNENGQELVSWLRERPEIEALWYPDHCCRENYDEVRRSDGGYGALFSMRLKGEQAALERFYDALEISKGPSLGTDFSLVCPYTLLAHYNELDWAAERGATSDLIRGWVGLEDPEDLISRFERAFEAMKEPK
ncbi:PLP-dependent transferase [Verrucomicrobiales bacterium BCK34]|nr:PLP-dependent transferase [Verrucomicrobiales bacterium BCK34]